MRTRDINCTTATAPPAHNVCFVTRRRVQPTWMHESVRPVGDLR